jgi:DNA-binding PucR family transcriptional regulator
MASRSDLPFLRDLVIRFSADPGWIPAVSAAEADAIHAALPELAADDELRRGTHATSESLNRLFIDMVIADQPMAEAELPPAATEVAREVARRGLDLDMLLRAYYVGHKTFFADWIRRVHDELPDPQRVVQAVQEGAAASFDFIQATTGDLVRRYAEERERWVRSAAAVRSDTVQTLLAGEPLDVVAAGARLRYDLERTHLGFVVWSEGAEDAGTTIAALERTGSELAAALGARDALLVPMGRLLVAGWIASRESPPPSMRLSGLVPPEAAAAIGAPAGGVPGFCRSHQQAMRARRVARLLRRRSGSVTRYGDVALLALASADLEHAKEFVDAELAALAAEDDDTLRLAVTLQVYLEEHASPRRAAQRLGIHENTVKNRIRAAQELLPRPLNGNVPEVLVALRLARAVTAPDSPGP